MQQRSTKKRPLGSDQEQSPLRPREDPSTSLFFPSGERRRDLFKQETSEATKRLRVDAPIFSSQGLNEGAAAMEPVANEALMGLATGDLIFYGNYFEKNKLLRELTFERETRLRFGLGGRSEEQGNDTSRLHSCCGNDGGGDDDDDL